MLMLFVTEICHKMPVNNWFCSSYQTSIEEMPEDSAFRLGWSQLYGR